MLRLLSYAYWAFIAITCPLWYCAAVVVWAVTRPFDRRRVVLHLFCSVWATHYVTLNPIWKLHTTGRDRLPWRGGAVLVANHASLIDILVLYDVFRPFKWVSKAEIFKVPFVGWNMVINDYVRLVRGDRESIRAMMQHCREHLARGAPVLIFPEGTRSPTGALQGFRDGAFKLAVDTGCPIIPVVIRGTHETLPKHGLVLRERMRGLVKVLDPIDPKAFESPAALRDATHAMFERELGAAGASVSAAPGR